MEMEREIDEENIREKNVRQKQLFDLLRKSNKLDKNTQEELYKILRNIHISVDTIPIKGEEIDIEKFFKKEKSKIKDNREIKIENVKSSEDLEKTGETYKLK